MTRRHRGQGREARRPHLRDAALTKSAPSAVRLAAEPVVPAAAIAVAKLRIGTALAHLRCARGRRLRTRHKTIESTSWARLPPTTRLADRSKCMKASIWALAACEAFVCAHGDVRACVFRGRAGESCRAPYNAGSCREGRDGWSALPNCLATTSTSAASLDGKLSKHCVHHRRSAGCARQEVWSVGKSRRVRWSGREARKLCARGSYMRPCLRACMWGQGANLVY